MGDIYNCGFNFWKAICIYYTVPHTVYNNMIVWKKKFQQAVPILKKIFYVFSKSCLVFLT